MRTIFALVNVPKAQQFGSKPVTKKSNTEMPYMARPEYTTQAEVTTAIANKTFKGWAPSAYAQAEAYELYQKKLNAPKWHPPKGVVAKVPAGRFMFRSQY